jgi:ribosome-associated toxin RatA of RatAB toxin-antitoxin module
MPEVHRSALLPYTPAQMYALVTDVRSYPEFLPWCTSSDIIADDGEEVTVKLGLSSGFVRASFTTRNQMVPDRSVTMHLVDGPFDQLEGRWDFTAIRDAGTRADLNVRFSTRGIVGAIALGPAFEGICNHLVDAFAQRARQVFGGD